MLPDGVRHTQNVVTLHTAVVTDALYRKWGGGVKTSLGSQYKEPASVVTHH